MKLIVCILVLALSGVYCGIHRSSYFIDRNDHLTNEIHVPLEKQHIVGAPEGIERDDEYVRKLLEEHLKRLITGDFNEITVFTIEEITQQIVAGSLYKIRGHYLIEGVEKTCVITVLVQPWITEEKVIISGKCDDGSCYVTEKYTCSPDSLYSAFTKRQERLKMFA